MDEYLQAFLNSLSDNTAYDYIANHYTQFTKEELKDIILECIYPMVREDTNLTMLARLNVKSALEDRWDYEDVTDISAEDLREWQRASCGLDC